jgi:hypothetical protein
MEVSADLAAGARQIACKQGSHGPGPESKAEGAVSVNGAAPFDQLLIARMLA